MSCLAALFWKVCFDFCLKFNFTLFFALPNFMPRMSHIRAVEMFIDLNDNVALKLDVNLFMPARLINGRSRSLKHCDCLAKRPGKVITEYFIVFRLKFLPIFNLKANSKSYYFQPNLILRHCHGINHFDVHTFCN